MASPAIGGTGRLVGLLPESLIGQPGVRSNQAERASRRDSLMGLVLPGEPRPTEQPPREPTGGNSRGCPSLGTIGRRGAGNPPSSSPPDWAGTVREAGRGEMAAAAASGVPAAEPGTRDVSAAADMEQVMKTIADGRPVGEIAEIMRAFPHSKLLSEAQRLTAHESLERRCHEVMDQMASCTLGGEAGRALLNDAQRELVIISRLVRAVSRPYVIVTADVSDSADSVIESPVDRVGRLPLDLREQVGLISAADIAETDGGDADVAAAGDEDQELGGSRACALM